MREPFPSDCPKREQCIGHFDGDEAQCPQTNQEIQLHYRRKPLVAAELLCIDGLAAHNLSRAKDPYKDAYHEIDYLLDFALAAPSAANETKIDTFRRLLHLRNNLGEGFDTSEWGRSVYEARLERLDIFLPAFKDRIFESELSSRTMREVHAALVTWLQSFNERFIQPIPSRDHAARSLVDHVRTEAEIQGLLTRLYSEKHFPWPTTQREEASHARSEHNHDFYTLSSDLTKVPIQAKKSKRSGGYKGVLQITHRDITRAIHETLHRDLDDESIRLPSITAMLSAEQRANHFDQTVSNILNLASMYVVTRIDHFNDFRFD